MPGLTDQHRFYLGLASAAVGIACLTQLVRQQISGPATAKSAVDAPKKGKKKSKGKSQKKKKGSKPSRETLFKIERECIAEFKAYLPKLGEEEARLFSAAQAGGRPLTQQASQAIQAQLIKKLEEHLEAFKKTLCKKYGCSEKKHDDMVNKLLDDKDPEIMKLMEESQKLWNIFKPRDVSGAAVPEHIDEDAAISYITRSFELVINSMKEAKEMFLQNGDVKSMDEFRDAMKNDSGLANRFNQKFSSTLAAAKKELMAEFNIDNEEVVGAMVAKYQTSQKFAQAVSKAKRDMDAYFQK